MHSLQITTVETRFDFKPTDKYENSAGRFKDDGVPGHPNALEEQYFEEKFIYLLYFSPLILLLLFCAEMETDEREGENNNVSSVDEQRFYFYLGINYFLCSLYPTAATVMMHRLNRGQLLLRDPRL